MAEAGHGPADLRGAGQLIAIGQLPESGQSSGFRRALAEQELVLFFNEEDLLLLAAGDSAHPGHGQLILDASEPRLTIELQGTGTAERLFRQADGGAEFHHRLIESAGMPGMEQAAGDIVKLVANGWGSDIAGLGGEPAQHARNVS